MVNKFIAAVTVILVVYMLEVEGCTKLSDCPCGKVCAGKRGNKVCKNGCMVFDKFVPLKRPGGKRTYVYGNWCSCYTSGEMSACTRAAWLRNPKNVPEYQKNPKCTV